MTDLDDRISTLLQERARDHVTDPRMPRTVATRSRRRRALVGTGAGLAAAAAIVVGAAALREVAFEQRTGAPPTVTPAPEPGPVRPETFVGLRGGEIVLVDAATGDTIRVLVDNEALGGPSEEVGIADLEVSPDGSTVYFVPFGTPPRIMSVAVSDGEMTAVNDGRKPTISPDGRYLAHVTCGGELGICGEGVSVIDLGSGLVQHWSVGRSDRWAGQLAWLPDSRSLAFSMFYPGDSNPTMHVLDTHDAGVALKDLEEIGPSRRGAAWTVIGYHAPTGGLVVRSFCCSAEATDAPDESSVISVTADGSVLGTLLPSADWIDIELDGSGRSFLLLEPGGAVYRMDEGGAEPVAIADADGFEDIDW